MQSQCPCYKQKNQMKMIYQDKNIKLLLTIIYMQLSLHIVYSADCELKFKTDFPNKEPVYTVGQNLIVPTNDGFYFNTGDKIEINCLGNQNELLKVPKQQHITAKCLINQTFELDDGTSHEFNVLGCKGSVVGNVVTTTTKCATRGIIKQIGYNINNKFLKLYEVCYDDIEGEAIYSDNVVYGSAILYGKSKGGARPSSFKSAGLAKGISDTDFKISNQLTTFEDLLNSKILANKYISDKSFLSRGHLSPNGDMVYVSGAANTFFLINVVPQWQIINGGNWGGLETAIRDVAGQLKDDVQVITGGYNVLEMADDKNNLVKMYLANKKLPIPKFVWKVIYALKTKKAIAFVSLNDPFTTVTKNDYLCTDICPKYGWGSKSWNVVGKGLIYCCDVDELRKKITSIPQLSITGVQEATLTP